MIHCVLHDPNDSVAVVVVEGVKAGAKLTGLILDEDRTITLESRQDIPIGHKVALKDMAAGGQAVKNGVFFGQKPPPPQRGGDMPVCKIQKEGGVGEEKTRIPKI